MNKTIRVAIILALSAGSILAQTAPASAQWRDGPPRWDDRRGPPPPPPRRHHRDRDNGRIIAGGLAAGVIGGLIGGALANGNNGGPRYIEEAPPPRPRCWYEDRRVGNSYDDGWHYENVRVCN